MYPGLIWKKTSRDYSLHILKLKGKSPEFLRRSALKIVNSIFTAAITVTLMAGSLIAQKIPPPELIPSQIALAKKVFISNTAGDDLDSTDPSQVYTGFYAAIKSWGRYELVSAPADADLVFEISFRDPIVAVAITGSAINVPFADGSYRDPHLRLVVLDPKTHVSLWWFMAHIRPPLFSSEKSLDNSIADLVGQMKQIMPKE
jgi:hypothetical protein